MSLDTALQGSVGLVEHHTAAALPIGGASGFP